MDTNTNDDVKVGSKVMTDESVNYLSLQRSTITASYLVPYERKDNQHNSGETLYVELSPWMYIGLQFITLRNVSEASVDIPTTAAVGPGYTRLLANNIHLRRFHFSGVSASLYLATKKFNTNSLQSLIQMIATTQQTFNFNELWNIFNAQEIYSTSKMKVEKLCPFVSKGLGLRVTRQLASCIDKGHDVTMHNVTGYVPTQDVTVHDLSPQDVITQYATSHNIASQFATTQTMSTHRETSHNIALQFVTTHNVITQNKSIYDLLNMTIDDVNIQDVAVEDVTKCDMIDTTIDNVYIKYIAAEDVTIHDLKQYDLTTQVVIMHDTIDTTTDDVKIQDVDVEDVTKHITIDTTIDDVNIQDVEDVTTQVVKQKQENQLMKTNNDSDIKHGNIKDDLLSNMCSQLEYFIKSLTTGKNLVNQPGVLWSENQSGVLCSEKQPGVLDILTNDTQKTEVLVTANSQINSSMTHLESSINEVSDRLKLFEFFPPKGNTLQSPFSPNLTTNSTVTFPNSNGEYSDVGNTSLNTTSSDSISQINNLNLTLDLNSTRMFPQHRPLLPAVSVNSLPKCSKQSLLPEPILSATSIPTGQHATPQIPQQSIQEALQLQPAQAPQQSLQQAFYLAQPVGNKFCQMPSLQPNPFLFANHGPSQFQHPMVANPVYDNQFYQVAPSTFTVPPPVLMFPNVNRWQQVPSGKTYSSDVDGRCFQALQSSYPQVNNSWGQQTQEQSASQWESLGHSDISLIMGQSTSVSTRASVNLSKQTKLPRGQSAFTALSHHRQMYVPSEKTYATAWRNEYDPMLRKIRLLAYRVMRNDLNLFDYQCAEQILTTAAHLKDIKISCIITNDSEWRVSMDNILLGFATGQWIQARERAYSIALQKILSCDLQLVHLDKDFLELHVSFEKLNQPNWMNSEDIWSQALKRKEVTKKSNRDRISSKGPMDKFKHVDEVILLDPDLYKSAAELLWNSVTSCDMLLEYEVSLEAERIYCCKVKIENSLVADGCAYSKEDALEAAAIQTVKRLKEVCWVIETKPEGGCDKIMTVDKAGISMELEGQFALKEDNVGYKLLKKMGWSGGGMGKNETGITKPVSYLSRNTREGLGHDSAKEGDFQFKCLAQEFLMAYSNTSDLDDMVFSEEFTHEEMSIMCDEGKQFVNLEVKIETKGDKKFMYVCKKRSPYELFDLLMLNKGETARFRLKSPGSTGPEVKSEATTKTKKSKKKKEKVSDTVE